MLYVSTRIASRTTENFLELPWKSPFHYFFLKQNNRWKKKGLAVVPLKFGVMKTFVSLSALVNIHSGDGSVLVNHGGIEMGQGINTKV